MPARACVCRDSFVSQAVLAEGGLLPTGLSHRPASRRPEWALGGREGPALPPAGGLLGGPSRETLPPETLPPRGSLRRKVGASGLAFDLALGRTPSPS